MSSLGLLLIALGFALAVTLGPVILRIALEEGDE